MCTECARGRVGLRGVTSDPPAIAGDWGVGVGEPACRRDSVPGSLAGVPLGDHPSVRPTRGLPRRSGESRGGRAVHAHCSALLRAGVTQPPRSLPTLVRSYRTVSPLPVPPPGGAGHRRSALCCPLPSDHSDLALASTLLCGVPTFLDRSRRDLPRSPDRLTDGHIVAPPMAPAHTGSGVGLGIVRRGGASWVVGV